MSYHEISVKYHKPDMAMIAHIKNHIHISIWYVNDFYWFLTIIFKKYHKGIGNLSVTLIIVDIYMIIIWYYKWSTDILIIDYLLKDHRDIGIFIILCRSFHYFNNNAAADLTIIIT